MKALNFWLTEVLSLLFLLGLTNASCLQNTGFESGSGNNPDNWYDYVASFAGRAPLAALGWVHSGSYTGYCYGFSGSSYYDLYQSVSSCENHSVGFYYKLYNPATTGPSVLIDGVQVITLNPDGSEHNFCLQNLPESFNLTFRANMTTEGYFMFDDVISLEDCEGYTTTTTTTTTEPTTTTTTTTTTTEPTTTTTTTTTTTEPTTTTTTTTSSSSSSSTPTTSSTTTTTPSITTHSTLYIFSILGPVIALVLTILSFILNFLDKEKKQPIPPFLASIAWYASSMWATRIRFPGDYTVSASTYYIDAGNPEAGSFYAFFALALGLYSALLLIQNFLIVNRRIKKNG